MDSKHSKDIAPEQASGKTYDVVIVGSGTCGSTLARELASAGKRVLVLERGKHVALRESFGAIASMIDQIKIEGSGVAAARGVAVGGSTGVYFAVVAYPDLSTFSALGIDLSAELARLRAELPINALPDDMLGVKTLRLRDAALACGHDWIKRDMLVDLAASAHGYAYDAKWKARPYLVEAIGHGADLVSGALVDEVLVEDGVAVGVGFVKREGLRRRRHRVHAKKVVIAAGELATPAMLRAAGLDEIGNRGFFCTPGYAMYGLVPGLAGSDSYVSSMGCDGEDGISLGDANMSRTFHRMMMLGGMKLRHFLPFEQCVGIGIKVADDLGGELTPDGRLRKVLDADVLARLEKGRRDALALFEKMGARHVTDFGLSVAGRVGGLVRIGEHLDADLQTRIGNLHVCDGSVIPDDMKGPPAVTLLCLSRYLARRLLAEAPGSRDATEQAGSQTSQYRKVALATA